MDGCGASRSRTATVLSGEHGIEEKISYWRLARELNCIMARSGTTDGGFPDGRRRRRRCRTHRSHWRYALGSGASCLVRKREGVAVGCRS